MTLKKHRYDIEICRLIASIMVFSMHIPEICSEEGLSTTAVFFRNFFIFFSRAGVPLFYMITGSLYLDREELSAKRMAKKAAKLYGLFLVWSGLYIIKNQLFLHTYSTFNEVYTALFTGHYHLWFLTSIATAYLFLPILHSAIHGKKLNIKYLMLLFLIVYIVKFNAEMLIPQLWIGPFTMISDNILPIFTYMLLGYFVSKRSFEGKKLVFFGVLTALIVVISVYIAQNCNDKLPNFIGGSMLPYSLMNFVSSIFVFSLCRRLGEKRVPRLISMLSSLSLGVYLIHPFFIEELARLEQIGRIPALFIENAAFLRFPAILLAVSVLSFLSSYIVSRIPLIKKLVLN